MFSAFQALRLWRSGCLRATLYVGKNESVVERVIHNKDLWPGKTKEQKTSGREAMIGHVFKFSARAAHLCSFNIPPTLTLISMISFLWRNHSSFSPPKYQVSFPKYQLNLVWKVNHPSCLCKRWSRWEPLCVTRSSQTLFHGLAVQSTELWKACLCSLVICLGNLYLERCPSHRSYIERTTAYYNWRVTWCL